MLDITDGTAVRKFSAPATYPQGLTFDGKYLWCTDRISDEIYMVEPQYGDVILMTQAPGNYPRGLAFDGKTLWHVDYQTDSLYQLVRQDDEKYLLSDTRKARVTFTHEVKCSGPGKIKSLDVYLALPVDLPQQRIFSMQLNPYHWNEVKDKWHQWFARYQYENLSSKESAVCSLIVETEISAINYFIFPDQVGSLKEIPKDLRKEYTADGSKYDIRNPYMVNITKNIVGNETNPYWMARRIYDFVGANLEYKLEGGWNTAPMVIQRGTGSCSEYSFVFIALCRAAGIPARYVGAVVVRGDDASLDDVFHRWPEIYLPNYGWIPMDAQAGDKPSPKAKAKGIGQLSNRFLITTHGGGDSEYLGWYYNAYETYTTDPKVKVYVENFGEWEPWE